MDTISLPKSKKHSQFTQEKFDKLLLALNADRIAAAEMYEHIRQAMIAFFSFRGASDPEELADETLNRVASRLSDGAEILAQNPSSYFYGFARNIWRETVAKAGKLQSLEADFPGQENLVLNPYEVLEQKIEQHNFERRLAQLNHCLESLSVENRELLLEYYQDTGAVKIENRQALAIRLGISLKTLRNKTALLRGKLANCVRVSLNSKT